MIFRRAAAFSGKISAAALIFRAANRKRKERKGKNESAALQKARKRNRKTPPDIDFPHILGYNDSGEYFSGE